jgi:carbamoyl-phosphate synthase small subunit
MKSARIVFQNGWIVSGISVGAEGRVAGRVVPHTTMTGYQELLSDPACQGQLVCMTFPLIGNVGVHHEFSSSDRIHAAGLILREAQQLYSSWMGEKSFIDWLSESGTVAVSGVDTREVMRLIRETGAMNAVISTCPEDDGHMLLEMARNHSPRFAIQELSAQLPYEIDPVGEKRYDVCVVDLGLRRGMIDTLRLRGCHLRVVPCGTSAADILALQPDGVVVSTGPAFGSGDLADTLSALRTLNGRLPILGVGAGFLALASAFGWCPEPMSHGHHGSNHPVHEMETGQTRVTLQNHWIGLQADAVSPDPRHIVTHRNIHDGSIEGIRFDRQTRGVQFLPDNDTECNGTGHIWDEFLHSMQRS